MAYNQVEYEWDVESVDQDGEIQDHHHCSTLAEALKVQAKIGGRVVLVRDDREDRSWAYLHDDGTLPAIFVDAYEAEAAKVPAKFHKEAAQNKRAAKA